MRHHPPETLLSAAADTRFASSCFCSVGFNYITGDGAENLAKVVLEHATLTDFCSIPLVSLRENSLKELDLKEKGIGVPGAIVLSNLLPSASALTTLEYAATRMCSLFLLSAALDT